MATTLLQAVPAGRAVAVKFTTTEDVFERCPRGTPCVVCNIEVPFRVIEDPRVLREPGTDTERLAEAGAARVVWAIARAGAASKAWGAVQRLLQHAPLVIMEGSTVVDPAAADMLLFVVHPFLSPDRWRPSSGPLIARADAVVVNVPAGERRAPSPAVLAELRRHGRGDDVRLADVTRPLEQWAPDLARRVESLLAPAQ